MIPEKAEFDKGIREWVDGQFPDVQGEWRKAPVGIHLDKGYPDRFRITHILNQLDPKSRAWLRRDYLEKYVREYGYNYGVIPVQLSPSILNAKFGDHVYDKDNLRRDLIALGDKGIGIYVEHDPEIGGYPLRKGRDYYTWAYFDPDFRKLYKPVLKGLSADRKNECASETASNVAQGELSLDVVRGSAENARGLPAAHIDTRESYPESNSEDKKTNMGAPARTGAGAIPQKRVSETEKPKPDKIDITQVIEAIQAGESERGMVSLDITPTEKRQLREMVSWVAGQNIPGTDGVPRIDWATDKVVSMLWGAAENFKLIPDGKYGISYLYAARKSLLQARLDLEKRIRARERIPRQPDTRREPDTSPAPIRPSGRPEPDEPEQEKIEEDRHKAQAGRERLERAKIAQVEAEKKTRDAEINRNYPDLGDLIDTFGLPDKDAEGLKVKVLSWLKIKSFTLEIKDLKVIAADIVSRALSGKDAINEFTESVSKAAYAGVTV